MQQISNHNKDAVVQDNDPYLIGESFHKFQVVFFDFKVSSSWYIIPHLARVDYSFLFIILMNLNSDPMN